MSIKISPSKAFSNGMEYEYFLDCFCYRCKKGKINENGFAEYIENGGCPIWDAMENARFDVKLFPSNDIVQIEENGKVKHWNICTSFETDDIKLMEKYKRLFETVSKEKV